MKNIITWLALVAAGFGLFHYQPWQNEAGTPPQSVAGEQARPSENGAAERILQQAFAERRSDIQIEGEGVVKKVLPDDNKGSRHQRFILQLNSGQTLLVAHNIDLADKITGLQPSDTVQFYGEYEWSKQGGVIHWTHRDPAGRHADGWLRHNGKVYQ
ncbi:DUF3465 domain-containing protein [Neisseria lisongii]|uniref:DUF3465 domain-containing protein n=1 Tax=Neisseria lisongii TaxID=2912188 RepID=A0AAW5APY8_9NEIS|nr:DUF3465 domain-containing protein [Neisseria lisongii]MCF7530360.1 DUF3465 domain-containing protein [Neisseria lisongii]